MPSFLIFTYLKYVLDTFTYLYAVVFTSEKMKRASSQSINPQSKKSKWGHEFKFLDEQNEIEGELWVNVSQNLAPGNTAMVSNKGRIKSYSGVIGEGYTQQDGYVTVMICNTTFRMHRVVVISFGIVPPSPQHKFVNHIDFDRGNNCLENLEWCTHSENITHAYAHNKNRRSCAAQISKPILCRKAGENEWKRYESATRAAQILECSRGDISSACVKGCKVKKQYYFKFYEEPSLQGEIWMKWSTIEVSNMGRFKDSKGIVKTVIPSEGGYCRVQIYGKSELLHRIIALCFLPVPPPEKTQVNHIDGNKSNNVVSNLEWATPRENIGHTYTDLGREATSQALSKKVQARPIGSVDWKTYDSVSDAARDLNMPPATISYYCHQSLKKEKMNTRIT